MGLGVGDARGPHKVASCPGHVLCPSSLLGLAGRAWGPALAWCPGAPGATRQPPPASAAASSFPQQCLFCFQNHRLPPRQSSKGWCWETSIPPCPGSLSALGGVCRQPWLALRNLEQSMRVTALAAVSQGCPASLLPHRVQPGKAPGDRPGSPWWPALSLWQDGCYSQPPPPPISCPCVTGPSPLVCGLPLPSSSHCAPATL
jgi:hypothetical protein